MVSTILSTLLMNQFLVWLSSFLIHLLGATLRVTMEDSGSIIDRPEHPPVIIAFWHNRTALMAYFYERCCRGRTALTFISRSRDGQFMTDVAARFGIAGGGTLAIAAGAAGSGFFSVIRALHSEHITDLAN